MENTTTVLGWIHPASSARHPPSKKQSKGAAAGGKTKRKLLHLSAVQLLGRIAEHSDASPYTRLQDANRLLSFLPLLPPFQLHGALSTAGALSLFTDLQRSLPTQFYDPMKPEQGGMRCCPSGLMMLLCSYAWQRCTAHSAACWDAFPLSCLLPTSHTKCFSAQHIYFIHSHSKFQAQCLGGEENERDTCGEGRWKCK